MQKFIIPVLITVFVACGIYAITDSLFSSKPKEKSTSSVKYDNHLKEVRQESKENLQAVKELPYDYKVIDDKTVFLPTWNNIFNTVTMPQDLLEQLMDTYNYNYDYKTKNNSWSKSIGNTILRINREEEGSLLLTWKNIELDTKALEQQLQEMQLIQKTDALKTYEYKSNNKTIRVSISHNGTSHFVAFNIIKN